MDGKRCSTTRVCRALVRRLRLIYGRQAGRDVVGPGQQARLKVSRCNRHWARGEVSSARQGASLRSLQPRRRAYQAAPFAIPRQHREADHGLVRLAAHEPAGSACRNCTVDCTHISSPCVCCDAVREKHVGSTRMWLTLGWPWCSHLVARPACP
jgi:hypothetical protein